MIDPIKEAFDKVKDDINSIKKEIDMLKSNQPSKRLDVQELSHDKMIKADILTPREQTIIKVIIDHKGMNLSYKDISEVLGTTISTIKNQIISIKGKTNLLIEERDKEGKKRYKLKEDIKIKPFLTY